MMKIEKYYKVIDNLTRIAHTSSINTKLGACIIRGNKMSSVCCNLERNCCRGHRCPSLHAEAHAMLSHFGKFITYSPIKGWCLLREKGKKAKGAKVRPICYSY